MELSIDVFYSYFWCDIFRIYPFIDIISLLFRSHRIHSCPRFVCCFIPSNYYRNRDVTISRRDWFSPSWSFAWLSTRVIHRIPPHQRLGPMERGLKPVRARFKWALEDEFPMNHGHSYFQLWPLGFFPDFRSDSIVKTDVIWCPFLSYSDLAGVEIRAAQSHGSHEKGGVTLAMV